MSTGLSHITFITTDLDRMQQIMQQVFKAQLIYASDADQFSLSEERFYLIGDIWVATMQGDPLATRSYNHVAFQIAEEDFDDREACILALGLELRPPRPRVPGEGRSLYFYDHDNHLFELHTGTLEQRLARYGDPTKDHTS